MTRQRSRYRTNYRQKRFNNRNSKDWSNSVDSSNSSNSSQSGSIDSSDSSSLTKSHENQKEIPGYYYDHEKNRYFKIMPNKSFGSDHLFSVDSVENKTKKRDEEKAKEFTAPKRISNGMSLLLDRGINLNKPVYMSKSENRQIIIKSLRQIGSIKPAAIERACIRDFQIHPCINKIFYGDTFGIISQMKFKCTSNSCTEAYNVKIVQFSSEVTSVRLERTDLLISTSLGSSVTSGTLYVAKLSTEVEPYHNAELKYLYQSGSTIWNSSFSEIDSSIALGSSLKLSVVQGWQENPCVYNIKTYSDVFALDFDRYQPNVVFAGCRDGKLRIYDLRSDGSYSRNGIGPMIIQKSPICHIKQIGAWYILSDGMNGSLSLWDIRNEKRHYDNTHYDNTYVCKPVIEFEEYNVNVNSTSLQYGFEVNLKEDIVAIAGQDNKVRFLSINTGRAIRPPIGPFKDKISSLRFCTWDSIELNPELDDRGEGVWIAVGEEFQWWSLGNNTEQD